MNEGMCNKYYEKNKVKKAEKAVSKKSSSQHHLFPPVLPQLLLASLVAVGPAGVVTFYFWLPVYLSRFLP